MKVDAAFVGGVSVGQLLQRIKTGCKLILTYKTTTKFAVIVQEQDSKRLLLKVTHEVVGNRIHPRFAKPIELKVAVYGLEKFEITKSFPTGFYGARVSERVEKIRDAIVENVKAINKLEEEEVVEVPRATPTQQQQAAKPSAPAVAYPLPTGPHINRSESRAPPVVASTAPSPPIHDALIDNLSGVPPRFPLEVFRPGHTSAPSVQGLLGAFLKEQIKGKRPTCVPEATTQALVLSTQKQHISYVNMVAAELSPGEPLVEACTNAIQRLAAQRKWRCSTQLKAAASFQGAMKILPLYFEGAKSIKLTESPVWTLAMRTFQRRSKEELPNQPKAATWEEVAEAIRKAKNDSQAMALLIGWLTAARLGCVRQLKKEHVQWNNEAMAITFHQGKGARARGPYTVHTQPIPLEFKVRWKAYLDTRDTHLFPRHLTGTSLKNALRAVNVTLEQRSIRRGALQTMALNNVDEDTLMRYSGHTQLSTLHRYLNWNKLNSCIQRKMVSAGQALVASAATTAPTPSL